MQIPILNGIYTTEESDYRIKYPRNLMPVPVPQGISNGYLRPSYGILEWGSATPGVTLGGISWNDVCYRVCGTKLCSIASDGTVTTIADIGSTTQASLDYSFDYLGVVADEKFFLYDGITLTQVTDPDLGLPIDFIWVDGYFMLTDGENLIVTELNDPFSILLTKYGSSEVDPDPIKAVLKTPSNEPAAINRFTIEFFDNIGGSGFPFQRIDGAQITRGSIGTHTCCMFLDAIAFVGSGRNEAPAIWLGVNGGSTRISNREIDKLLKEYTETELANSMLEAQVNEGHQLLYLHLKDKTMVYDAAASAVVQTPVWFELGTGLTEGKYQAKDLVWCYNKWLIGHTNDFSHGYLTEAVSSQWGEEIGWEFNTLIVYNEGLGAIIHELELVGLPGRAILGDNPTISTSYSLDGETWSQERFISAGKQGQRNKRLAWLQQAGFRNWRIQKFKGTSNAHCSFARLEAQIEPLVD